MGNQNKAILYEESQLLSNQSKINILRKVKEYLNQGVPPKVIAEVITYLEERPTVTKTGRRIKQMAENEIFCSECDKIVKFRIVDKEKTYQCGKERIEVKQIDQVAKCGVCGYICYHEELDDVNIKRAYRKAGVMV